MDPISPLHLLLRQHLFYSSPFLFSFQELRHRQELRQGILFGVLRALPPQRSGICFPPSMASLSEIPEVRQLLHSLSSATLFLHLFMPFLFFFLQNLRNDIVIPISDQPNMICLGPMGDPDPTEFINLETNRIPFKTARMNLDWSLAFRSWPNPTPGWRNWFHRMSHLHQTHWDTYDIGQCITLSLSETIKNELMLISASYFWSDTLNAFLLGHGPMTPTLLGVMMLTGLNISSSNRSYHLLSKTDHRLDTKNNGGWKGYIEKYSKSGTIDTREHAAFLNMWLEKYFFCGKTVSPTSNNLKMAESLALGNHIPLGKHLLGLVYRLLHQVSVRLRADQPINNLGGPWWFIQL
jgi:hypothetical protein